MKIENDTMDIYRKILSYLSKNDNGDYIDITQLEANFNYLNEKARELSTSGYIKIGSYRRRWTGDPVLAIESFFSIFFPVPAEFSYPLILELLSQGEEHTRRPGKSEQAGGSDHAFEQAPVQG